ncbi:MAG: DNA-deoxyinosine glycosylase [Mycobacterium kyogaense]|uniref:DNA-deoxyinosine glycosylase n=1 Tax=Mycobacterium kyogaense TaxID=2212479 RepID=UPI002FF732EB
MESPLVHSFAPLAGDRAEVLILGNMPGVVSLNQHRYYANPRNAFWPIMAALFGFDAAAPYDERVHRLTDAGVAVWDVLAACRRPGSLDAAVEPASMVANDFDTFFAAHPGIERVYFNGAAAAKNYQRLVRGSHPVRTMRLPSTSPAHTAPFAVKLAAWRQLTE